MVNYPWAPGYPGFRPNTSQSIAKQTESTYFDYMRIKKFEDVGYFLQTYVVDGGFVTKNIYSNNEVDVSDIIVSIANDVLTRDGTSFKTKTPSSTYYLDFTENGDFAWGTYHPSGSPDVNYVRVAEVTTDEYGNVNTIADKANYRSTFKLKLGYDIPDLHIDGGNFKTPYNNPDLDGGSWE